MEMKTFAKGLLMGVCDTVPGISGGTIAFITGIYAQLITSIHNLTTFAVTLLGFLIGKKPYKRVQEEFKKTHPLFLASLGAGIITAILLFSKLMEHLLTKYEIFVMAYFIGLIIASTIHLYRHIENHNTLNRLLALLGVGTGILLLFLIPLKPTINPAYLFLSGILASTAMILPGISGSFVLLILGVYAYIITAIAEPIKNIQTIILVALGVVTGLLIMARILHNLFEKHSSTILYLLVGLVIGSLSIPLRTIHTQTTNIAPTAWTMIIALSILGALTSTLISLLAGKKSP